MNQLHFDNISINIDSTQTLFERAKRYFSSQEKPGELVGSINVIEEGHRKIEMTDAPYDSILLDGSTIKYYRYDTLVREVFQEKDNLYVVKTYVSQDEEAILKPFRELYYASKGKGKTLVHGTLLSSTNGGILLFGPKRVGKSTLTTSLAELDKINVIAEGQVLIDSSLSGTYVPKATYLRIYPFVHSKFSNYLHNLDELESTQPIDPPSWERIKKAKYWTVDENITISRAKYLDIIDSKDIKLTKISSIILPQYVQGKKSVETISSDKMLTILQGEILAKHSLIENKFPLKEDYIRIQDIIRNVPAKRVSFSKKEDLTKSFLEEIIS